MKSKLKTAILKAAINTRSKDAVLRDIDKLMDRAKSQGSHTGTLCLTRGQELRILKLKERYRILLVKEDTVFFGSLNYVRLLFLMIMGFMILDLLSDII